MTTKKKTTATASHVPAWLSQSTEEFLADSRARLARTREAKKNPFFERAMFLARMRWLASQDPRDLLFSERRWGAVQVDGWELCSKVTHDDEVMLIFGENEPVIHDVRAKLSRLKVRELGFAGVNNLDDGSEGDTIHTWVMITVAPSAEAIKDFNAWLDGVYAKRAA
jgi:hypothetical protein